VALELTSRWTELLQLLHLQPTSRFFSKGRAIFGSGVRNRTVQRTTVSLKMIGGLRGIITVKLELTRSRSQTGEEVRHVDAVIEIF
jgi:hypothetical protein